MAVSESRILENCAAMESQTNRLQRTRPTPAPRALLVDSACKTLTVRLSQLINFPSPPRNIRSACACSWRTPLIASADSQLCNWIMRPLSSKLVPACFSYSLRAASKSAPRLDLATGSEDIALEEV